MLLVLVSGALYSRVGPAGFGVMAALCLVAWELRLDRRDGEPVIQVSLLSSHRSFGMGHVSTVTAWLTFLTLSTELSDSRSMPA